MLDNHQTELLELVGSPAWKALLREAEKFTHSLRDGIYVRSRNEWDFIEKEIRIQTILSFDSFFRGLEQEVDRLVEDK